MVFGFAGKTPAPARSFHLGLPALQHTYASLSTDILHRPPCDLHAPNQNQAHAHWSFVLPAKTPPLLELLTYSNRHFDNHHISPFHSCPPLAICMHRIDTDPAHIGQTPASARSLHLGLPELQPPDLPFPQLSYIGPLAICMQRTDTEPDLGFCRPKPPPLLDLFTSASQHFNHHISPFLQTSSTGPLATCMDQTKTKPVRIGLRFRRPKTPAPARSFYLALRPPYLPFPNISSMAPLLFSCTRPKLSPHASVFGFAGAPCSHCQFQPHSTSTTSSTAPYGSFPPTQAFVYCLRLMLSSLGSVFHFGRPNSRPCQHFQFWPPSTSATSLTRGQLPHF